MPVWLCVVLCALLGYLLGCINPAYLFARAKGFDIRERGSGNAGGSNAIITMGKTIGVLSSVFDIFKAWLAALLAVLLFPELSVNGLSIAGELAGISCMLGHMFPVFMGFRGGKGLACMGGLILYLDWKLTLCLLAGAIVLVLLTDYICVVPLTVSILFPILYWLNTRNTAGALILCIAIPAVWFRHAVNIRRIFAGTEAHFSLLWNRDREIQRVSQNEGRGRNAQDTPGESNENIEEKG